MTDAQTINPLRHPICLTQRDRIAATAWARHIPFGTHLVNVLRPRVVVQLGTFDGVSYCTFCQPVKPLDLPARCYAIETWRDEYHANQHQPAQDYSLTWPPRVGKPWNA